jgi:hypothetical protein
MAEPIALKYRAFISYSHADTSWAKWLQGKLEGFRIDKDLVGLRQEAARSPRPCVPSSAIAKLASRRAFATQTRSPCAIGTWSCDQLRCCPRFAQRENRAEAAADPGSLLPVDFDGSGIGDAPPYLAPRREGSRLRFLTLCAPA